MTIRTKLLAGYGAALLVAFVIGISSLLALLSWRESAGTLIRVSSQRVISERVRAELMALDINAREFVKGELDHEAAFWKVDSQIAILLQKLQDSALSIDEREHIEGLRETHDELVWIMRGVIEDVTKTQAPTSTQMDRARLRLDEIALEVSDDMAVLNQYYRDEVSASFSRADRASVRAMVIVIGVGIAAMISLLMAVVLMRRWLSTPILGITNATSSISAGDFSVRAPEGTQDEWGELAKDINRMAESLREFEARLRDQERLAALGEVAAYAAHNIRNPLAGVRAAAQVLQVELPETEPGAQESLVEMIEAIDRLDVWVTRMMTFAKPLNYQPQPIDVNETIQTAVQLSRSAIREKQICLTYDLTKNLPRVSADSSLLEQAYSAIINNAIDAVGHDGRITIESRLVPSASGADCIEVTFKDNGPGVAEEMQDKLFRLFASGKDDGSGLGLAQAKRIFETHHGTIQARNASGAGCIVITLLPVSG